MEPCQTVTFHVGDITRHFLPRTKLTFPLTGVAGSTSNTQFILQGLNGCPNCRRDLKDRGGLRWVKGQ